MLSLADFPILVCDLASGTDAIIGTDMLGSVLPDILDMKNGLLFTEGGASLQLHHRNDAPSGRMFTVGHCSVPPYSEAVLHCTVQTAGGRVMPSSGLLEGLTVFAENTGLVVGRTLMDSSRWRILVLVSNFGQDTVMVEPFSEVGMVTQVSAIQAVTEDVDRSSHDSPPRSLGSDISRFRRESTTPIGGCPSPLYGPISYTGIDIKLNDAMVKGAYPLPRIDDTLDMLADKQWFSTLNLASGYTGRFRLLREARAKTAFATHSGLFQSKVMPFGLSHV